MWDPFDPISIERLVDSIAEAGREMQRHHDEECRGRRGRTVAVMWRHCTEQHCAAIAASLPDNGRTTG